MTIEHRFPKLVDSVGMVNLKKHRRLINQKMNVLLSLQNVFKMGQPRPLFCLFLAFSNKQYNFYNKSM